MSTRSMHSLSSSAPNGIEAVGFANFPNQVFRRCIKQGFDFSIMVVGQSGLGKSTFINTLFLAEISDLKPQDTQPLPPTVAIEAKTVCLIENDVPLYLTFVDTPGFGDAVDNSKCMEPIMSYIDDRFAEYLSEETKIERSSDIEDNRVHLCFYFIAPTGHGLKELDLVFMKKLQDRVNIVPIIAKGDTLTHAEMQQFKKNIVRDLQAHGIQPYQFPTQDKMYVGKQSKESVSMDDHRKRIPFAVVGSNKLVESGSRRMRVREYAWGTVEVENMSHNDFIAMRDLIIRSNLVDLIYVTHAVHYENYRYQQMCKGVKGCVDRDPFTQLEQERETCEREAEEVRATKENIFKEKVASRERKIGERTRALEEIDKENRRIVDEKHRALQALVEECNELRRAAGINDSGGSGDRGSPLEKAKKKSSTLSIFNRN